MPTDGWAHLGPQLPLSLMVCMPLCHLVLLHAIVGERLRSHSGQTSQIMQQAAAHDYLIDALCPTQCLTLETLSLAFQLPESLLNSAPHSQEPVIEMQLLQGNRLMVWGHQPLMEKVRSTTNEDRPYGMASYFFLDGIRECLHLLYGKTDLPPTHVNYG